MEKLELYKEIFNSAPDGVVITDSLGTIILVNKQMEKLFGYKKEELIGQKIEVLIPKRFQKKHIIQRTEYVDKSETREMGAKKDLWGIRKDGTEFAVEVSLSPIRLEDKILMSAAIRDVTERKKAEQEIERQNKKLQFQYKELEQFAYIASHDLQEPLKTLISFTELIREEFAGKIDESADQYIDFIIQSSERMQSLVKGLLDYSRIGKDKQLVSIDCNILIQEVLQEMSKDIQKKQALISVGKLPKVIATPNELKTLFKNLINNALKFTKKDIAPEISISSKKQKDGWHFSVHDNGIGISEFDKEKIFVIFKRLHNRNEYEGTGIGLAHCKKIVELHGGNIWIESNLEKGSVFNFTIPKF